METKRKITPHRPLKRIAVFSDTHGNGRTLRHALKEAAPFDLIIHLGDGVLDGEKAAEEAGLDFIGIAGNEDYNIEYNEKEVIEILGHRFILMHGHQLQVNAYMRDADFEERLAGMADAALFEGVRAFFFGHSHKAALVKRKGIILCNPGDQYIGSTLPHSFAIVEIFEESFSVEVMKLAETGTWYSDMKEVKAPGDESPPGHRNLSADINRGSPFSD